MSDQNLEQAIKEEEKQEKVVDNTTEEASETKESDNIWEDALKASQEIEEAQTKKKISTKPEEEFKTSQFYDKERPSLESSAEFIKLKEALEFKENQFKRLAADFENVRRRQAQEKEDLLKFGLEKLIGDVLPIIDNFERAISSSRNATDVNSVISGVELIQKQLMDLLNKNGVEYIEAMDKPFDPKFHEAVQQMVNTEKPDQTILVELQKGYTLYGRVLRPSMVVVSTES